MRSLSLVRMPCFRRCSMISTTSPNHEGVEGTECEEVWMMTEESAILVMCTSLLGKMCILPQERHILCLLATNYISLRNSWANGTAILSHPAKDLAHDACFLQKHIKTGLSISIMLA